MKKYYSFIAITLRRIASGFLRKYSYIHIEEFTRPYIIKKSIEGVDFLLSIRDSHAKLWYDLYSTDPDWIEMRFIRDNLVNPGDVVIECGSHHGCTAICLSKWVGSSGFVHAYEPGKGNFEVLKENIALNNIVNINPINEAVGDKDDLVEFVEFFGSSMGSQLKYDNISHNNKQAIKYEVKQTSIDKHIEAMPSLIKIDTQGYVYQPLLGAKKIIEECKPNLALEIDPKQAVNKYGNNFEKIFEIIKQDEYTYFIQFESFEYPKQIEFSKIIIEWEKRNKFSKEIHLFAKNSRR